MSDEGFQLICEVEPATQPDLMKVRHQIGVMSRIASAFLIPDNHIGRATVSSIAVAHEVAQMGGRSIACLNARDRNVLGFRRDLLTAAAPLLARHYQLAEIVAGYIQINRWGDLDPTSHCPECDQPFGGLPWIAVRANGATCAPVCSRCASSD